MEWWQAALWGLAGGLSVEALELYAQIHRTRGAWSWRRPIPQGLTAYVISVVIRPGLGALLAAATATDGSLPGALAALGLGVAAPLIIEKLARAVIALGVDPQTAPPAASPAPDAQTALDSQSGGTGAP